MRLTIQQPSLPAYRLTFFSELAKQQGVELRVVYGNRRGITNEKPVGFKGEPSTLYHRNLGLSFVYWHWPQWCEATSRRSDVLVLVWNIQYLSLLPGLIRAKINGVRTVLWGHGHSKKENSFRRTLRYLVTRLADGVIFYDEKSARQSVDRGWLPRSKVFVAPNSIDGSSILKMRTLTLGAPDTLRLFQEKERIDPKSTVLFVSRLHRDNRLDLLLHAYATLNGKGISAEIVIIGKGNDEKDRLQEIAETLGISKYVRFLGPIFDEGELAKWFLSSRVFCYPENMGLSLYHAMFYGLPVITADDPSCHGPEFHCATNDETVILYSRGSVDDLSNKLQTCLLDDVIHRKISEGSQRYACNAITIDGMVNGFMESVKENRV